MEAIQGSNSEASYVATRKYYQTFEGHLRQSGLHPQAKPSIAFEISVHLLGFSGRYLALKDMLGYGMRPLRSMQRREPDAGVLCYTPLGLL